MYHICLSIHELMNILDASNFKKYNPAMNICV